MLGLAGLGLAAYVAWSGLMATINMPSVIVTEEGFQPVYRTTARIVAFSLMVIQVTIILLLTAEVA